MYVFAYPAGGCQTRRSHYRTGSVLTLPVGGYNELVDRPVERLVRKRFEVLGLAVVVDVVRREHAVCLADEDAGSGLRETISAWAAMYRNVILTV